MASTVSVRKLERRIPDTVAGVNGRVDSLEAMMETHRKTGETQHEAVMAAIGDLKSVIGSPSRGDGAPADGMFHILENLDKRVKPFEAAWLQVKGATKATVVVATPLIAMLWWFAGDRISALLH